MAIVKVLLWVCGIVVTSNSKWQPNQVTFDAQGDFLETIQSADFGLDIAWKCSGIEGMLFFCFFISVFILYDWHLFGRVKNLISAYLMIVALVLVVNAIRIASIFLYAEWMISHGRGSVGKSNAIYAFHDNAGLTLYAVVATILLPLMYRWARRQGDIRRPVQERDGPTTR